MRRAVRARGSHLRVHFKNTMETANALRGLALKRAQKYLKDVLAHKDAVPFRRHRTAGRHAQGHRFDASGGQSRWPEKSCRFLLDLLQNAESNAEVRPAAAAVCARVRRESFAPQRVVVGWGGCVFAGSGRGRSACTPCADSE